MRHDTPGSMSCFLFCLNYESCKATLVESLTKNINSQVCFTYSQIVVKNLFDLKPATVEEELQQGENGDVQVKVMTLVTTGVVKKLSTN